METIKLSTGSYTYDPHRSLGATGSFGRSFYGASEKGALVVVKKILVNVTEAMSYELSMARMFEYKSYTHVLPYIDAGRDPNTGGYYVVMPLADTNLRTFLESKGPLSAKQASALLLVIISGLEELNDSGHGNLKPENVLFHEGRWKLADFGVRKLQQAALETNDFEQSQTPYYFAPEQWKSEPTTLASDIYALGCIGYYLVRSRPPFIKEPRKQHLLGHHSSSGCADSRFETFVDMALKKQSTSRPDLGRVKSHISQISLSVRALTPEVEPKSIPVNSISYEKDERISLAEKSRRELVAQGYDELQEIVERMWERIGNLDPTATKKDLSCCGAEFKLKQSRLFIGADTQYVVHSGAFVLSQWDVVGMANIVVEHVRSKDQYVSSLDRKCQKWEASLWYMKPPGSQTYRWVEAAYFQVFGQGSSTIELAKSIGHADVAASNVMGRTSLAYVPVIIDGYGEARFAERWIWAMLTAGENVLPLVAQFPISVWPDGKSIVPPPPETLAA